VSPVKYELGFYNPEDGILHSRRREDLKSYMIFASAPIVLTQLTVLPLNAQPCNGNTRASAVSQLELILLPTWTLYALLHPLSALERVLPLPY
jgi:hypothetical protein